MKLSRPLSKDSGLSRLEASSRDVNSLETHPYGWGAGHMVGGNISPTQWQLLDSLVIVIVSSRYFRARSIDSTAHAYRGATKIRTAFSVRPLVWASRVDDASSLKGTFMKGLFAGSTVALLLISASLLWSPNARGGQPPKAAHSEDVGQALNSYEGQGRD